MLAISVSYLNTQRYQTEELCALCLENICQNSSFLQIFPSTFFYLEFLKKSTKRSQVCLEFSLQKIYIKLLWTFWKYWFPASLKFAVLLFFNDYITQQTLTVIIINSLRDASYFHHFKLVLSLELAFSLESVFSLQSHTFPKLLLINLKNS